jgi:hypothetical protein
MESINGVLSFLGFDKILHELIYSLAIINHMLQAMFFSIAVCSLVELLLKIINFSFAK